MSKCSFISNYLKERSRAGKTSRTIEACCLLRFKIDKLINKEISVTNNSKAVDLIYNLNKIMDTYIEKNDLTGVILC